MMRGKKARSALVCTSAVYMALGAPAWAQNTGEEALDAAADTDMIVVTGSRIARRDYDSESPIVTVTAQAFENSGSVAVDEQLKELPQFTGGVGATSGGSDVQQLPTNSPGIATVNLRGLGSNRTLVLLDGRRVQPANATGVVDTNVIPRSALQGVEVITGGAASTYGADAVAGVVNFQLKRNFTGVDFDVQYGVTERGDGQTWDASVLLGSNFADDRGNAMLGINYSDRGVVEDINIPFMRAAYTDPAYTGGGTFQLFPGWTILPTNNLVTFNYGSTSNSPTQAAINQVFAQYGVAAGDVPTGANTDLYFNGDGTLFYTLPGAVTGAQSPNFRGTLYPQSRRLTNGGIAPNSYSNWAQVPLQRYSLFAHAYYEVTDGIEVYVQGLFNHSQVETQALPSSVADQWGLGITFDAATCGAASGHPVPADMCTLLASRPNPNGPWELNWPSTWLGPQRLTNDLTTWETMVGLRGDLPMLEGWTFDLYGSHGRSSQETEYNNFVNLGNAQTLIGKANYGAGATFFNPRIGLDAKCTTGLNPFSVTAVSDNCRAILSPELHTTTEFEQNQVELNIQGGLFQLPAGEVRGAFGASYRDQAFDYSPDAAFRSDNLLSLTTGVFSVLPASGAINVREFYGELLVPVLADMPFIQEFNLNAGIRQSDYNTEGGVLTWKLTADWTVSDYVKIRGGYQLANRAPNVAELFQPGTYQTVGWTSHDPCSTLTTAAWGNVAGNTNRAQVQALCNAIAGTTNVINNTYVGNQPRYFPLGRDFVVGNPNVRSEEAKTWTAGVVVRAPSTSPWLENLTLSLDYYNIRVNDAIQSASTQFVYEQCFNADGSSNSTYSSANSFCKLIIRDSTTGFWLATRAEYQNLGYLATSGIDATLDWSVPAPGLDGEEGAVMLNLAFNWLNSFDVQATPGGAVTDYKGTISSFGEQFDWRLNTTIGYDFGPGSVSLAWRHRPGIDSRVTNALMVESHDIFDLAARFELNDALTLRAGVENLLDQAPPRVGVVPGGNSAAGTTGDYYDVLGRRFYVGIKAEL